MKYNEVISLLASNLLNYFDNVYHSAELIKVDNNTFPAVIVGDDWLTLEPNDQREIIYIRRNGDDEMYEDQRIGSCVIAYKMRTPLRVVYFKDHDKCPDDAIVRLMKSALTAHTKLRSVIRDKWKLLKEESNGDYTIGASTTYIALDIFALWSLLPDTCENDFCVTLENPLCKESI